MQLVRALALALGSMSVSVTLAQSAELLPIRYNEVELQAEATREVQNDLMNASLYVELNDANPAPLASALNRSTNEALKIANAEKAVRARSGGNQTYPVYDRNNKITGWRGRSELRLESKDFQALGALIGKLQGSMQLAGVAFQVSPELRRQTENELIAEAIGAFRTRADIARQALGGKAIKIRRIAVATAGGAPPPRPMVAMRAQPQMASAEVAPAFEGGTSQVQVSVSGTIEAE